MFRLSRKDKETGNITHSVEQETNVLSDEHVSDWNKWGQYDLITEDISQELSDKAQLEQNKTNALIRIRALTVKPVLTVPELTEIVRDLVDIVKG